MANVLPIAIVSISPNVANRYTYLFFFSYYIRYASESSEIEFFVIFKTLTAVVDGFTLNYTLPLALFFSMYSEMSIHSTI